MILENFAIGMHVYRWRGNGRDTKSRRILNESRSSSVFYSLRRYLASTLPTVFWKQPYMSMNADIWTAALFPERTLHAQARDLS